MKKIVLAASIAAIAATSANAAPKVYGKAFATVDYVMTEKGDKDESAVKLHSNASRLGVKGSEKLTGDLKAVYKAEYQINVDGDSKTDSPFSQRNIYVGLSSKSLGTLLLGNVDSPVKTAQKKVDLFNDLAGGNIDMKKTFAGEVRAADVIAYTTPKGLPVAVTIATNLSEKSVDNEDRDNGYHLKAAYNQNGLYLAAAGAWDAPLKSANGVLKGLNKTLAEDKKIDDKGDVIRLVGQYKMGGTQFGAMIQQAEPDSTALGIDNEMGFLLSAKHKVAGTPVTVKGQFQMNTTDFIAAGTPDAEITQFALGGEYKLSKATKAHAYFATRDMEQGSSDSNYSVVGAGLEHKF